MIIVKTTIIVKTKLLTLLVHEIRGCFWRLGTKLLTRGNIHQKKGNLIKNPNINVTRANPVMRLWDLG